MDTSEVQLSTARPATESAPAPLAHQAVHDTAVNILQELNKGKLLDVPAGEGALAVRLIAAGFEVYCCDLYPEIFRLPAVDIRRGDLGATLPYPDQSFDYIACLEGLEHIENPQQAIREFARLLRPGGQLIASVPNIQNIEERLKWLVYGYTSHFKPLTRASVESARREFSEKVEVTLHVNAISYSELRYTLEEYGFEIVKLYRDKPKAHAWAYWPIVALIRFVAHLTPKVKRRERWTEELTSDEVLLGGNTLIVHAILKESRRAI
jgi:SAM-dependent methyltransferase